jgi:hypothetical protein
MGFGIKVGKKEEEEELDHPGLFSKFRRRELLRSRRSIKVHLEI